MICDLETVPGFAEFFEQFPADQRQRRMGQRFPLAPDIDDAKVPGMVEGGTEWICEGIFPAYIYKQFKVESSDPTEVLHDNTQLFKFLYSLHRRRDHLGRVVGRGLASQSKVFFLGGCYVAGTSREAAGLRARRLPPPERKPERRRLDAASRLRGRRLQPLDAVRLHRHGRDRGAGGRALRPADVPAEQVSGEW